MRLESLLTLLTGEEPVDPDEDIAEARRELESALDALRRARGTWLGPETLDVSAVRRALELAERQLDAARVRLQQAEARRRRG